MSSTIGAGPSRKPFARSCAASRSSTRPASARSAPHAPTTQARRSWGGRGRAASKISLTRGQAPGAGSINDGRQNAGGGPEGSPQGTLRLHDPRRLFLSAHQARTRAGAERARSGCERQLPRARPRCYRRACCHAGWRSRSPCLPCSRSSSSRDSRRRNARQKYLLRLSLAAEKPGLAEPFTGITANGRIESGLFAVRSTGVSTAPVRAAAETFLAGLTPEQRAEDGLSRRRSRVAEVDEPELLRAPGRQLPGDDARRSASSRSACCARRSARRG